MAPPYSKLMSQLTGSSGSVVGGGIDLDGGSGEQLLLMGGGGVSVNSNNTNGGPLSPSGSAAAGSASTSSSSRSKKKRKQAQSASSASASAAAADSRSRKSSKGSSSGGRRGKAKVRPRLREQEEELLQQVQGGALRPQPHAHPYLALLGGNGANGGSSSTSTTMMAYGDGSQGTMAAESSSATMGGTNNPSAGGTTTTTAPGADANANANAAMMMSMNPRIMALQRQIAREAALMATMTSAQQDQTPAVLPQGQGDQQEQGQGQSQGRFQGQYQPQPRQQQMLPTVGNGITYNAISMTAQPPQQQQQLQPGMNHLMANNGAASSPATNNNSSSSASSSVSSAKSSTSTSLSRDGSSSRKKKKKKKVDREGVPPFFYGKKLRSGLWLQAEIDFAMEIIKGFRGGNLPDCEEGTTLRPYLARKLHCNPMRLSKKLSKAMSNSDTNATNPGSNGPGYYHKPQTPSPSQRFTDLERAFHRATLDRKAILACNSVCSSKAPTPPPATAAKNASEGQGASASSLMMPVSVPPPPPQPGTATNAKTTTDLGSIGQGEDLSTVPVSNPFAMPMYQSGQQEQPQPMMPTNSIESALLQNQASMQAQMASQMRQIQQLQESLSKAKAELEKKEQTVKHQAELHQSFLRALNSRASSSSSPDSQEPTNNTNAEGQESEKGRSDSTVDYTEILAGFEKVAAPSESGGATDLDATQIPLWSTVDTALPLGAPETPTMTSKSFDDFHRFLGQGIPSMPNLARGEQNNAPNGENGRGGVKPRPIAVATLNGPATEALHGARDGNSAGDISFNIDASEDYSLLAQQSVLAAMQHSAYAASLKTKEAGNAPKKKNSRTISEANSSSSSASEPGAKRTRTAVSPQRSTVSTTSSSNSTGMRGTVVTESESMFDSSSRGVTSSSGSGSSGSGSDNDNSNDGTTSNDGSDDAVDSFGDSNATAKVAAATTKATKDKATMDVSGSPQ